MVFTENYKIIKENGHAVLSFSSEMRNHNYGRVWVIQCICFLFVINVLSCGGGGVCVCVCVWGGAKFLFFSSCIKYGLDVYIKYGLDVQYWTNV